jgi:D-lactate dehydrogenase
VDINTGDLVRRLRAESRGTVEKAIWKGAAKGWAAAAAGGGIALTVAKALPSPLITGITQAGRAVLGSDTVPLYARDMPKGGKRRPTPTPASDTAEAVFFAACVGTMFGPAEHSGGVTDAFLKLCERADVELAIPESIGSLCCGTPWKSKGYLDGYSLMVNKVLPSLLQSSRGGEIPIVCDAASCTEGLETMKSIAIKAGGDYAQLHFLDSVEFVKERVLPSLALTKPVESLVIHHTCSTVGLGINASMDAIARFVSSNVHVPLDWGCCAFAGDRGLLHPELTASATAAESASVNEREFAAYVSANRTCELGMSRATGHQYRHLLEVLEEATR